jgi:hypothetical protein
MKKIVLLVVLLLCATFAYSQKKKPAKKSANAIAMADNLSATLTPGKDQYIFEFLADANGKKDSLFSRKINVSGNAKSAETKNNNIPTACKITPFLAKGTKLYTISWTTTNHTEVTDKVEDKMQIYTEVWNAATKKQLLANVQTATKIKEILWLDKLKNASQTSEKLRKEGSLFTLTPEGDVVLTGKSQESKLAYNPATDKYDGVKTTALTSSKPSKKK